MHVSLLQQENYGKQNLSHFSHLTFIILPLYPAKQTLMVVEELKQAIGSEWKNCHNVLLTIALMSGIVVLNVLSRITVDISNNVISPKVIACIKF